MTRLNLHVTTEVLNCLRRLTCRRRCSYYCPMSTTNHSLHHSRSCFGCSRICGGTQGSLLLHLLFGGHPLVLCIEPFNLISL